MQMLAAGGIPPLTDSLRVADDDNPRGYYELESARQIGQNSSFLEAARGKAVKLIHALVVKLPESEREYRIVFMDRPIEEVIRSQSKMLEREGKAGANLPPNRLGAIFQQQREGARKNLDNRPDVQLLDLDYPSIIADPQGAADKLNNFLGGNLDVRAMIETVDPDLYRNRG